MSNLKGLKIGFFGTPDFALEFLKYLYYQEVTISFVVSQPASLSGRGKKLKNSPVQEWAKKKHMETFTPLNLKDQKFKNKIKDKKADFIIVAAYGRLIDEFIIDFPKFHTLNVHGSLLPKWRGAAPIQRSILNGDKETGVSIMKVVKKLDAGPVVLKKKILITTHDNSESIYKKILLTGKPLLKECLIKIISNDYSLVTQDESLATYAKKIEKKEARINWNDSAQIVHQKIRAFNPSPGAFSLVKNSKKRIKILKADIIKKSFIKDYKNLDIGHCSEELIVRCGDGFIKVLEIQPEGKAKLKSSEFLNGYNFKNLIFE